MGWLSGYNKRMKMTIDGSKISENLNNFPIMVNLGSSSGVTAVDTTDIMNTIIPESDLHVDLNTKLLLHMDDTSLGDSSYYGRTITKSNNVTRSDTQSKFGGYSAYFDGSGDRLMSASDASLYLGTDDFTIDFWICPINGGHGSSYARIVQLGNNSTSNGLWIVSTSSTNPMAFLIQGYSGGYFNIFNNSTTIPNGAFSHFALTRYSGVFYLFYNGVLIDTNSSYTSYNLVQNAVYIGSNNSNSESFYGYIDEFRLVKGSACWTTSFTVPIVPYYDPLYDAKKLAITDSDGTTQQYVEIESCDTINKTVCLWTSVSGLQVGTDKDLFLYYDSTTGLDNTYVGETGSSTAMQVWDSGFISVYHMNQSPVFAVKDSTMNGNNGASEGSMAGSDYVISKNGYGVEFDGSDDMVVIGAGNNLDFVDSDFTMECVFKSTAGSTGSIYSRCFYGATPCISMRMKLDTVCNFQMFMRDDSSVIDNIDHPTVVNDGNWHYGTIVVGSGILSANVDGGTSVSESVTVGTVSLDSSGSVIGSDYYDNASNLFDGVIDEIRISSVDRSSSWLNATYYSIWDMLIEYKPFYGYIEGYVYEKGIPVQRIVNSHTRPYGIFTGSATSGVDGYYVIETTYSGAHYLVCLDDEGGASYNDLIIGDVYPTTVSG